MFLTRSEYDRGVGTFSPEGRLFQVEYAIEAIKLGSTAVGIRTNEGVILAVEKRLTSPLVTSTLAKGVGVMAICFPILLVLHGALGSPALLARSGLPAGLADPLLSRAGSVEWE